MEALSNTRLSRFAKLRMKKYRDMEGLFIAEGEKSVREMVDSFTGVALIAEKSWFDNIQNHGLHDGFKEVLVTDEGKMKKLTSFSSPPAVMAVFEMPEATDFEIDERKLYLAIDGVQDPGNMGTIIRTADWFGIKEIFASQSTVDVYNSKTIQATMGSLSRVKVRYTDLEALFGKYRQLPVYGTLLDGDDIYDAELSQNGFIVMGNEGNGISGDVRKCVTHKLLLPPYPAGVSHAESLNVGVATALVVAEFRRRMMKP